MICFQKQIKIDSLLKESNFKHTNTIDYCQYYENDIFSVKFKPNVDEFVLSNKLSNIDLFNCDCNLITIKDILKGIKINK